MAWFNTVMCRGFFELYSIDKNPSYLEDVRNTMLHAWFGKAHHISGLINDEDLSGAVSMNKWEILRQASLVELYALLAIWSILKTPDFAAQPPCFDVPVFPDTAATGETFAACFAGE